MGEEEGREAGMEAVVGGWLALVLTEFALERERRELARERERTEEGGGEVAVERARLSVAVGRAL
jgi:hypothetical protein